MKKFPSLNQFRNVVREVRTQHDYKGKDEQGNPIYLQDSPYPTLKFRGTVKLHGTNAGIVKYKDRIEFQSRERVLTPLSDNIGFATKYTGTDLDSLFSNFEFNDYIAIYGEWCCGNIQKNVALTQIPEKRFVIFGVKIDDVWVDFDENLKKEDLNIFNILQFPTYEVEIDFNNPEAIQNKLIELTLAVEEECPVGKYFGVSGIGEGIVFQSVENKNLIFKSKGEKHSVSKVKVLNSVDPEKIENVDKFIEYAVTENRLNQGLENVSTDIKDLGNFIKWMASDIVKEELDTLQANNLTYKDVASKVAQKSKEFFLKQL